MDNRRDRKGSAERIAERDDILAMFPKQWKRLATGSAFVLLGGLTGMAGAAPQIDDFETTALRNDFRPLEAEELAELRGRFVQGNSVLLFGMEMSTVWTSPSGKFETRANLQVDLAGASPSVTFTPNITANPTGDSSQDYMAAGANSNTVVVDRGTGNAKGVVQVVQVGGDGNTAGNNFKLDINHGGSITSGENIEQTPHSHASDSRVAIQSGANGLGMRIHVPGQGEVTQGIYAGRGLHQSIQLTGSGLNVNNTTHMQVQMREGIRNSAPTGELRRALQSTRALERHF